MTNPFSVPKAASASGGSDNAAAAALPLWKAFWLIFIPSCLVGNELSVVGLLLWKTRTGGWLLSGVTSTPLVSLSFVLWMTLALPIITCAAIGVQAIWRAREVTRYPWVTWIARTLTIAYCAWMGFILIKAFLRAFRGML